MEAQATATVKEVLAALYHHPDDAIRTAADRWLQQFQHTLDAWQVFSNILKIPQIQVLADSDEQEVVQQVQILLVCCKRRNPSRCGRNRVLPPRPGSPAQSTAVMNPQDFDPNHSVC